MNSIDDFAKAVVASGFFGIGFFSFIVWLYALISALKNERLDSILKLTWVLVILFVPLIGPLIYIFVAPHRPTQSQTSFQNFLARQRQAQKHMHCRKRGQSVSMHPNPQPPEVGS